MRRRGPATQLHEWAWVCWNILLIVMKYSRIYLNGVGNIPRLNEIFLHPFPQLRLLCCSRPNPPEFAEIGRNSWKYFKLSYLLQFSTKMDNLYMEMKLGKRRTHSYLFGSQKMARGGLNFAKKTRPSKIS